MLLNEHSNLRGKHSIFSPSQPAFFNYNPEDFFDRLMGKYRSMLGTEIHNYVCIKIKRFHKITSIKDLVNGIDEFIFKKYYNEMADYLPVEARRMLMCLRYLLKNYPEVLDTVKTYINDAIGYKMSTEVCLYYNDDFFGHADALVFNNDLLRIHDLKTGSSPVHIEQLLGYSALFCLEYNIDPNKIDYELRIYQNNDILIATPTGEDIKPFIEKYRIFNSIIERSEGGRV